MSVEDEASSHSGSLLKPTMDDTHTSDEGDRTGAWVVSVLKPLADSPSVLPEVSPTCTQQEQAVPHHHKFVDGYSRATSMQVEMKSTRDATLTAEPHIRGTQTSSFLVTSPAADHHLVHDSEVGKGPAPILTTFSQQTEGYTSHDPTWRPLTGRKLEVRLQCALPPLTIKGCTIKHTT